MICRICKWSHGVPTFSSATVIVSGAYPMPSRRPSVCSKSVNLSSNRIGSISFNPIFPIFDVNVHNDIAQNLWKENFEFLLLIFKGSLITKKVGKEWEFCSFLPFSPIFFNTGPWNLVYGHIDGSFRLVWKMAPVGQIFGSSSTPNKAKIGHI